MKGIDTNVLVRYILQDDAKQSHQATSFIEKECSVETPGFITGIILCELVWVLEKAYGYEAKNIALVLKYILETRQFHIHQSDIIWQAFQASVDENVSFADAYITKLNAHYACEYTITFDKKASRLKEFKLLTNN
jgi:predicted nucleic-acid-binding protein